MKAFFAIIAFCLALTNVAMAQIAPEVNPATIQQAWPYSNDDDRCQGPYDEDCTHHYRTCVAKDSNGRRYSYTASDQYPNKYIVNGAINKCRQQSNNPSSCRWATCRWAD